MRGRATVQAVWDSDIVTLLKSLGVLDELVAGDLTCEVCGDPVDLDNLGSLSSQDDRIIVTCDKTGCVRAVTAKERADPSG